MKKRLIFLFVICIFAFSILLLINFQKKTSSEKIPDQTISHKSSISITPSTAILQQNFIAQELVVEEKSGKQLIYKVYLQEILPNDSATLITNFTQQKQSNNLFINNNCRYAINGGFYTKEQQPLGLLIIDGNTIGRESKSLFLGGFVYADQKGQIIFTKEKPINLIKYKFIFQTGPFLIDNGKKMTGLQDEKRARRSFLLKTQNNRHFIGMIFNSEQILDGPTLQEFAQIFQQKKELPFETKDLINLDGGSASCFYSLNDDNLKVISELSPIGTLICFK